jgi:acetylornithine aminotransferase
MELKADIKLTSADVVKAAMGEGLLLVPAGPKVIRFVPPLIVSAEEIDQAAESVEKAIATLAS